MYEALFIIQKPFCLLGVVLLGVAMGGRIMKHGRDFRNNWTPLMTVRSKGGSDAHFLK